MKKLTLFEKIFIGSVSIKLGEDYYVSFPKIGPFFGIGLLLVGFFSKILFDIPFLFFIGLMMSCIGLISFFYFDLFPKRQPKNEEEAKQYNFKLNHD